MEFIKEESGEIQIEEIFSLKQEETDEQTDTEDEEDQSHEDCWWSAPFRPNLVPFQGFQDDGLKDKRTGWQPVDYVQQYIDSDLMNLIADSTNAMSLSTSGRSLDFGRGDLSLFGAAILMSCVPYPQIRMFWSNPLQIPAISNTMTHDRFIKLRSHLKVVNDSDVSEDTRETDKFWKVRPFIERIRAGCRLQVRPECVSVGEQMIPFTGACPFQQYVPLKPNTVGMKNFVLLSVDGLVLDFEVNQGSKSLASKVQDLEGLGLRTLVIKRLSETLTPGTQVYCDRFFTSVQAVDHMLQEDIYLTGRVMKSRVEQAMRKLPSDKTLRLQGRGAVATVTRADGKLCVVKWYDNNPVVMLSTVHSDQPEDSCQRWSKKGKYVTVTRPSIVREYNSKMGGVAVSDRVMSNYQISVATKKWTIRLLMHFTDLALANSWLLYRRDKQENGTPRKSIMKFLEFRMVVAQVFLSKRDVLCECAPVTEEEFENGHFPPPGKKTLVARIPTSRSGTVRLISRRWWL